MPTDNKNLFFVGEVERIELCKLVRVCACCNLSTASCACEHDNRYVDLTCIRRDRGLLGLR